ncbi:MAG: dienelactone hydrolase family protein [Pseudomonadota bacterium]
MSASSDTTPETLPIAMSDGLELGTYVVGPEDATAAIVVIQEIFGVNSHIRSVADGYALAGYRVYAPQLFDRVEPGIELSYDETGMSTGISLAFEQLKMPQTLEDLQRVISHAGRNGKVGVVGFCFGGLLTWLAARDLTGVAAASAYYGGGVPAQSNAPAQCPTILHFGDADTHIPTQDVERFRQERPETTVYRYPADHGFNCDQRSAFDAECAKLAHARTLEFFSKNLR